MRAITLGTGTGEAHLKVAGMRMPLRALRKTTPHTGRVKPSKAERKAEGVEARAARTALAEGKLPEPERMALTPACNEGSKLERDIQTMIQTVTYTVSKPSGMHPPDNSKTSKRPIDKCAEPTRRMPLNSSRAVTGRETCLHVIHPLVLSLRL